MAPSNSREKPELLPGASGHSAGAAIHHDRAVFQSWRPLRIANRYVSRPYRWKLLSIDGQPVADRNGVKVAVDGALGKIGERPGP